MQRIFLIGRHSWRRGLWLGAWLALVVASTVEAQTPPSVNVLIQRGRKAGMDAALLNEFKTRAAGARLDDRQSALLLEPAVQLAERDLPSEQVLQKTFEGLAKHVPVPQVQSVLTRMRTATEQAGTLADPWLARTDVQVLTMRNPSAQPASERRLVRNLLIESTAQALTQNVPAGTVRQFLELLPERAQRSYIPPADIAVAVRILADLPAARTRPESATELLISALDAGFSTTDLGQLPAAVSAAERHSRLPPDVVARGAAAEIRGGAPAAQVLGELFKGNLSGGPPGGTPPGLQRSRDKSSASGNGQGQGPKKKMFPPDNKQN